MKLRVAQPEQGEMVRRFGGTSVTISAPEVPSALDRGVVDGIFTAGVGAVLWKDLLKFGYLIPVNWNNSYILANAEAFNKLSPDLQAKLRKAAQDAAKWNQDTMQTEEAASVKTLTDAGYTMTTAPAEEAAKVADTMKPYWDDWAKSRGPTWSRRSARCARRSAGERCRPAGVPRCRPTARRQAIWSRRSAKARSSGSANGRAKPR